MKKLITVTIICGLALIALPASAGHWNGYAKAQARLAKIQEHRGTYLPRRYQSSNVIDAAAGFYKGAATIIRSKNGIQGRIMSNVPTAGDPYTLWGVVFNNPVACDGPCDDPDIGNPKVRASVFNLSGAISAANGNNGGVINLDFSIVAGNLANDQFILLGEGDGLVRNNGFKAQVVLVIDQHPSPGTDSWIEHLTRTNLNGDGSAINDAIAVFVPCPERSCPASVL